MTKTGTATLATAITGLVAAILACLVAFGVPLTGEQQTAILGLVGAILLAASAVLAARGVDRSRVVEQLAPTGVVLAGEANELHTGSVVRNLGDRISDTGGVAPAGAPATTTAIPPTVVPDTTTDDELVPDDSSSI